MPVLNPPPVRIPQEYLNDANKRDFYNGLINFLRLLWNRVDTDGDLDFDDIFTVSMGALAASSRVSAVIEQVEGVKTDLALLGSHAAQIAALQDASSTSTESDTTAGATIAQIAAISGALDVIRDQIVALQPLRAQVGALEGKDCCVPSPDVARYATLASQSHEADITPLTAQVAALSQRDSTQIPSDTARIAALTAEVAALRNAVTAINTAQTGALEQKIKDVEKIAWLS